MSKVVTIPTYQSPFVVMVNGVKYVFPAGSVQEVPDEVAVVIEANGRKKPEEPVDAPFDCCEGGGSGGGTQSDWNQTDSSAADFIKNKPFGDMPTGGDTLYWDGNAEGLEVYNGYFFKVSDEHITREQLVSGYSIGLYEYGAFSNITYEDDRCMLTVDGELRLFIDEEQVSNDSIPAVVCNSGGVWFFDVRAEGLPLYASSLTIPGYTGFPVTKKMEEKYLPGAVILYADAENYLYATSDTSDTSKRMTKEELRQLQQSGLAAYVDDTAETYWAIVGYYFAEEYGEADVMLNIPGSPTMMAFYTAEYTAS